MTGRVDGSIRFKCYVSLRDAGQSSTIADYKGDILCYCAVYLTDSNGGAFSIVCVAAGALAGQERL